jgi:hypothetical protein
MPEDSVGLWVQPWLFIHLSVLCVCSCLLTGGQVPPYMEGGAHYTASVGAQELEELGNITATSFN